MSVCYICGRQCNDPNYLDSLSTTDHIMPKVLGGSNTVDNKATACLRCNQLKNGNPPNALVFSAVLLARKLEDRAVAAGGSTKVTYDEDGAVATITINAPAAGAGKSLELYANGSLIAQRYQVPKEWTPAMKRKVTLALKEVDTRTHVLGPDKGVPVTAMLTLGEDGKLCKAPSTVTAPVVPAPVELPQKDIDELKAVETMAYELHGMLSKQADGLYKINFTKKSYVLLMALPSGLNIVTATLVSGPQHCPSDKLIKSTLAYVNDKFYKDKTDVVKCAFCGEPVFGAVPGDGAIVCHDCVKSIKQYFNVQRQLAQMMKFSKGVPV